MARVFSSNLYEKDLEGIYGQELSAEDSLIIRKAYVDKWVEDQLLAANAERNLSQGQKQELERQVEEYRKSLITFYFEKEYSRQHLDTVVSDEEIRQYYDQNKSNFLLADNIIKVSFVKLRSNAQNLKLVREYLQSEDQADINRLRDYCERNAENFYIDNDSWILFDDLLREVPIVTYNQEAFLQNNRFVDFEDAGFRYLVHIKGFRIKSTPSPISFEYSNIYSIILNKRKQEIVNRLRNDIVRRGVEEKSFEVYSD